MRTLALATLALAVTMPIAHAEPFGFGDLRKIVSTLSENELRFKRDYADKPFEAVGPFSRVTTMIFPGNQYLVEIGKGPGLGNVHCHFPTGSPVLPAIIEWKKGLPIKVTGTIRGQSLIGDLTLNDCVLTPMATVKR